MPTDRMGPPPGASPPMRMTASWSGSTDPTAYKSVARRCAPMASSPRILNRPTGTNQTPRYAKSPSRSSSSLRVLRRQGAAKHKLARRQAAKLCYRFGPLTPSARSANLIAGDGTKNGFPAPNKEPATNQKYNLTEKAPYRFESASLQQTVCLSRDFSFLYRKAGCCRGVRGPGQAARLAETQGLVNIRPTAGNVSVGRFPSTAVLAKAFAGRGGCAGAPSEVGIAMWPGLSSVRLRQCQARSAARASQVADVNAPAACLRSDRAADAVEDGLGDVRGEIAEA